MKNSLDELLGVSSGERIGDYSKGIDVSTPQSTSTSIRYGVGSLNSSKDKNAAADTHLRMKSALMDSELFNPQMGLFTHLRKTLDEIAVLKKSQALPKGPATSLFGDQKFDLNFKIPSTINMDFTKNLFSELNKHSSKYNTLLPLVALGNTQQQDFYAKIQQLQNVEQQLAIAQTSENSPISKTTASYQILPQSTLLKFDDNKMDIQKRRDLYQESSSLNSLEEEVESNIKPATQLNHLSISSVSQLDGLNLESISTKTSIPTKLPENRFNASKSVQDLSNATLQQRLELHYAKNMKQKAENDESFERQGASNPVLGIYSMEERIRKILQYKKKIVKWRVAHPPNRSFSGRSAVAGSKPRIKGKFVKKDEYQKYLEVQKKNDTN